MHWNKAETYLLDTLRSRAFLKRENRSFLILRAWQQSIFTPISAFLSLITFSLPDTAPDVTNLRHTLLHIYPKPGELTKGLTGSILSRCFLSA